LDICTYDREEVTEIWRKLLNGELHNFSLHNFIEVIKSKEYEVDETCG
jgi:hypothetical protein